MKKSTRAERLSRNLPPAFFNRTEISQGMWYEADEEIVRRIRSGQRKAILLSWVRSIMITRLTERERFCIELCYFEGLSMREAARRTGTSASSVCRAVQRGIRRLRIAKEEEFGHERVLW